MGRKQRARRNFACTHVSHCAYGSICQTHFGLMILYYLLTYPLHFIHCDSKLVSIGPHNKLYNNWIYI
jgi:hypothetical protein